MTENTMDMHTPEEVKEIVPEVYDETGIIGPTTKVAGNITTKGHLDIQGAVNGNIEAKGNILVSGNVIGEVKCSSLLIQAGAMESQVEASSVVSIKEGAVLTGKITCKDITIEGTVQGDIVASGKVGLASTAVVKGNVTAAAMGMEIGAKLSGTMCIA